MFEEGINSGAYVCGCSFVSVRIQSSKLEVENRTRNHNNSCSHYNSYNKGKVLLCPCLPLTENACVGIIADSK